MRRWLRPSPSNVEESATGALLGRAFVPSGALLMERLVMVGFEVNRDETMFRDGFLEGEVVELLALCVVSVTLLFVTTGPSCSPASGRFRFPSTFGFLPRVSVLAR